MDIENLAVALPNVFACALYAVMALTFTAAMVRWRRRPRSNPLRAPRVTIFKPLAGKDDELVANLASFALLDYPSFEVLLGVSSVDDPAYDVARAFVATHPDVCARVIVTDPDAAINPKVAQLIGMESRATGTVFVISDSNVRVSPSYLMGLVRELEEPGVALVTSVFVGTGERSVGAALENLQLGAVTAPGIVAASLVTSRPLTVGKSMAMGRRELARLGGFRSVGGILAEDHVLGRRFLDAGHRVGTSLDVVENRNIDCTFARTIERHTRWAKIRRALNPGAFFLEPLLSPLTTASLVAVVFPSRASVAWVVGAAIAQTVFAAFSLRLLRGRALAWHHAPLEIVRTYVVFVCWARAVVSRRLSWRGHAFLVEKNTVIVPAPRRSWSRIRAAGRA